MISCFMDDIVFKGPLFICAGEPSGDMYAALLIKRLKKKNPNLKIYGVGGDEMRKSGVQLVEDYNRLMTFGFSAGIFSSFRDYRIYRKISRAMHRVRPKTFIPVAYPGMNLLLCRYAGKLGCEIYYYLPPQIWAWGELRKYFIKKWVDNVISVFPFEYEFYKRKGIKTTYLENPLFEKLKRYERKNFEKRIGFMPGSRRSEIKRNLPVMIEFIRKMHKKRSDIEFCIIHYSDSSQHQSRCIPYLRIITKNRYQTMKDCDLLIVCSGTASLEAAIMNIPQVFFNRPSFLDYYVVRRFLKIKEYNLTNLYFHKKIVPSLISRSQRSILKNLFRLIDEHLHLTT